MSFAPSPDESTVNDPQSAGPSHASLTGEVMRLQAENQRLQQALDDLQAAAANPDPSETHEAIRVEETRRAETALQQLNTLKALYRDAELSRAIQPWAIDPAIVLEMTREQFDVDEQGRVVPQAGNDVENANGHPYSALSPAIFYERFRRDRPYLTKASASIGAGSLTQTASSPTTSQTSLEELADMPMEQFIKSGGLRGTKP